MYGGWIFTILAMIILAGFCICMWLSACEVDKNEHKKRKQVNKKR